MSEAQSSEVYFSGDAKRQIYANSMQPDELYALLQASFPWVKRGEYFSISTPTFHEVMQEDVMTCCIPQIQARVLLGDDVGLGARKFCMQSKTSYLRSYRLFDGERPAWAPECAKMGFITKNHPELGRPFPDVASTFCDVYFWGPEAEIEAHFGLPEKRGAYQTYYGVTVVDGSVARVKQYCYDEQSIFSDWEVALISHCKKIGRTDLM